jgi:hypothetical protein
VRNKARLPFGASDFKLVVGDYTNPILKPKTAEVVKKFSEISLSGPDFSGRGQHVSAEPRALYFWSFNVQLLQQPGRVTLIYRHDREFRVVRLSRLQPATLIPSVHGDSMSYCEGDTLVIDTVGINLGPHRMIDRFATPYTQALRVVERYRPCGQATMNGRGSMTRHSHDVPERLAHRRPFFRGLHVASHGRHSATAVENQ